MNPNQQYYSNPPSYQQNIIVVGKQKSVGVAFLLSFFFGPLGLFYASVAGGIIMCILSIIIGILTLGIGLIFTQLICVIWAVVAANNANQKQAMGTVQNYGNNYPSQQPMNPPYNNPVAQPPYNNSNETILLPPSPVKTEAPQVPYSSNVSQTSSNNLNGFTDWVDNNKKGLIYIVGGVVILLGIVGIGKFALNSFENSNRSNFENADSYSNASPVESRKTEKAESEPILPETSRSTNTSNSSYAGKMYIANGSEDNKVYFHNAPDESTRRKAYILTQERVYVEDIQNDFGYVSFTNTRGQTTKGWIKMSDLIISN